MQIRLVSKGETAWTGSAIGPLIERAAEYRRLEEARQASQERPRWAEDPFYFGLFVPFWLFGCSSVSLTYVDSCSPYLNLVFFLVIVHHYSTEFG